MKRIPITALLGATVALMACGGSKAGSQPQARVTANPTARATVTSDYILNGLGINATDILHIPGWVVNAGEVADAAAGVVRLSSGAGICATLDDQMLIGLAAGTASATPEPIGKAVPHDLATVSGMYEEACVTAGFLHNVPTPTK